jgi:hypothetical protein
MKSFITINILAIILVLAACSTGTKLTGSWSAEPGKSYNLKNIAIIGVASKPEVRKGVEDAIETLLDSKGFNSTGALMFLPPHASKENITREIVVELLEFNKFDGVVTISLIRKDEESRYVSGSYYYVPAYYDVPFNDYYGQMTSYVYSPGYYEESVSFLLQTNLYSFPDGKLLWAAQTETNPMGGMDQVAAGLANTLVNEMIKSKIIIP